jgi:dynamin family protein
MELEHSGVDHLGEAGAATVEELTRIGARFTGLIAPSGRAAIADALARVAARRVRILVLGEAKRGKSTLVNALFGCELVPTGVLPLTSVATEVTVSEPGTGSAEVRYVDGSSYPIGMAEVAGLVSEAGNPGNVKQVDRVALTAPSGELPAGTEVVDTPGTGSVIDANTGESARARSVVDVAVLVVSVDPPVSAAELALAAEVMATAARLAVVLNKPDLIRPDQLTEVYEFTARAVRDAVGRDDVPVFATRLGGPAAPEGLDELVDWLRGTLAEHGTSDVLACTARSMRATALTVIDQLRVELALAGERGQARTELREQPRTILDRARVLSSAATDRIDGEARRLRARLDGEHERQVEVALARAHATLGDRLPDGPGSPERRAERLWAEITDRIRASAESWFLELSAELEAGLRAVSGETLSGLDNDLRLTRRAAGTLLRVPLSEPDQPAAPAPPRIPTLYIPEEPIWRELLTGTIAEHLPAPVRARQLHRQLRARLPHATGRPFGRMRSALHDWLRDAARTAGLGGG